METGMKNLKVGESFIGFSVIRKKELKSSKDGNFYLQLEVGDQSGRMRAKLWQEARKFYNEIQVGQVVKMKGKIGSYRNISEIWIERLRPARSQECPNPELFLPTGQKNLRNLMGQVMKHRQSLQNSYLAGLLDKLFPDEESWENYLRMPSGKLWHHNYLQGNLEHIACLLDVAAVIGGHYPNLNLDLLKCGILLHNVANRLEFNCRLGFIEYTTRARLVGHTVQNCLQLQQAIREIEGFPEDLEDQLLHMVISQDDNPDKRSCLPPMTLEAIILNSLIQLDIYANAADRIMRTDRVEGSDWTRYNNLFKRFLYSGPEAEPAGREPVVVNDVESS